MCTAKKPKTAAPTVVTEKDLPILRNPYLDGANAFAARGVRSLRIDRASSGTTQTPTVVRPVVTTPTPPRPLAPGSGGGTVTDVTRGDIDSTLVTGRRLMLSRQTL